MKKLYVLLYILFSFLSTNVFAGGGLTHMYVAHEAIEFIPDANLRNLLLNNLDAYLVGAYYPDSGYVAGNHYGEDSHWDPFIFAFADYIKETYPDAQNNNPKLIAFLFGVAAHSVADIIIHRIFYDEVAEHDFKGDTQKAHQYGDPGIDLLVNIDKSQWLTHPITWWVPVKDLVAVYKRMGKPEYTKEEIIRGNRIISLAGIGERIIALPAYPYLRWKMPWTAKNYDSDSIGGLGVDETKIAEYQMRLWQRLTNATSTMQLNTGPRIKDVTISPLLNFDAKLVEEGVVQVDTKINADGSVEFEKPMITEIQKFKTLLLELKRKIFN